MNKVLTRAIASSETFIPAFIPSKQIAVILIVNCLRLK